MENRKFILCDVKNCDYSAKFAFWQANTRRYCCAGHTKDCNDMNPDLEIRLVRQPKESEDE